MYIVRELNKYKFSADFEKKTEHKKIKETLIHKIIIFSVLLIFLSSEKSLHGHK